MVKKLQALRAKKGFTLVELIVVIAIIGVLAAILVPTMMNVVTKARVSSADQTAKSIADSVTQWLSDIEANRGAIPDGGVKIAVTVDSSTKAKKITVTYLDTDGKATVADGKIYKRTGSDTTFDQDAKDGTNVITGAKTNLAGSLLADDLYTNYPFKGGEVAVIWIKQKHVVGVAYSDDGSENTSSSTLESKFSYAVFTAANPVYEWASSSKEGITKTNNNIVGTNPKLLYGTTTTTT